jgi:hypothetical protein
MGSSAPSTSSTEGLFGSPSPQAVAAGTGGFGCGLGSVAAGTGGFGCGLGSSSMFGSSQAGQSSGGIFGSSTAPAAAPISGRVFGSTTEVSNHLPWVKAYFDHQHPRQQPPLGGSSVKLVPPHRHLTVVCLAPSLLLKSTSTKTVTGTIDPH